MKIVVISHAMVQSNSRQRWQRLAEQYSVDVTLLVPSYWQSRWFGGLVTWRPQLQQTGRYQVLPMRTAGTWNGNHYVFLSADACLRQLQPDLIYVVQGELAYVLQQMIVYRRLWSPRAKLAFFSWNNNLDLKQVGLRAQLAWRNVCRTADAAIGGNYQVVQMLQKGGFHKPVFVQTEIGFNEEQFYSNDQARARKRAELGLTGFIIGFAGRLVGEKGIMDMAAAVSELAGDWSLLMVGGGPLREEVQNFFRDRKLADRLYMVGEQPLDKMPEYLNAMDVLVLPSYTTTEWKEQFGLVLAQAMACRVPVVGSDSGAIPEVIEDAGLIFAERNVAALRECLQRISTDKVLYADLARRGYERALIKYSANGLAEQSFHIFSALVSNVELDFSQSSQIC